MQRCKEAMKAKQVAQSKQGKHGAKKNVYQAHQHHKDVFRKLSHPTSHKRDDNSLILHIYIIIRNNYHTYFELIHAFYSWFWNNTK